MKCDACGKQLGVPQFKEIRIDMLFKQYTCQRCGHYQEYTTTNVSEIINFQTFNRHLQAN